MMTQRNDHIFIELWRGSRKSAAGTISVLSYLKHVIMFDRDLGFPTPKYVVYALLLGSCKLNIAINPWYRDYT